MGDDEAARLDIAIIKELSPLRPRGGLIPGGSARQQPRDRLHPCSSAAVQQRSGAAALLLFHVLNIQPLLSISLLISIGILYRSCSGTSPRIVTSPLAPLRAVTTMPRSSTQTDVGHVVSASRPKLDNRRVPGPPS
jgi:hypothetical protein